MNVYERIRKRRIELGMSQEELAFSCGFKSRSSIAKIESGKADIRRNKLEEFARALKTTPSTLMGWDEEPASEECLNFPVIGEVAAGYGSFAEENETGDYEQIPLEWIKGHSKDDFFVLRVKGNSMYPEFKNGDHVLIKRCSSVDSGSVAVVIYDSEEATLKKVKYIQGEDWLDLVPINPEYETKHIENSDLEECRVLGEAVKIIRHLK